MITFKEDKSYFHPSPRLKRGSDFKDYLYSLRYLIAFSALIFVFSIFYGYTAVKTSPTEARSILEQMRALYEPIAEMSSVWQFLFVFLNNALTSFLMILLGLVFGIFPFLVLFSNGTILGILAFSPEMAVSWKEFFTGTLPHGIIEIPVVIIVGALGFRVGQSVFQRIFKGEGSVKTELFTAFKYFFKFLLPLLAVAAAIEIFITANLLGV